MNEIVRGGLTNNGSPEKFGDVNLLSPENSDDGTPSTSDLMKKYLKRLKEVIRILDQNHDEKIEVAVKNAENIFLNVDKSRQDPRKRYEDAFLALDRVGKEEKIN